MDLGTGQIQNSEMENPQVLSNSEYSDLGIRQIQNSEMENLGVSETNVLIDLMVTLRITSFQPSLMMHGEDVSQGNNSLFTSH